MQISIDMSIMYILLNMYRNFLLRYMVHNRSKSVWKGLEHSVIAITCQMLMNYCIGTIPIQPRINVVTGSRFKTLVYSF